MIRLFCCAAIAIFVSMNLFSQTTENKVKDFLGDARFSEYQNTNPGLIEYLKVKVDEGYMVSESVNEKKSSYQEIDHVFYNKTQISIEDFIEALESEEFNILHYSFPNQDSNTTRHYLLGESNILLTVYANSVINRKVQKLN